MRRSSSKIAVSKIKEIANSILSDNRNIDVVNSETRKGVAQLLERILMETGNYRGFNFVQWTKEGGFENWQKDGEPRDNTAYLGDQSRRIYY